MKACAAVLIGLVGLGIAAGETTRWQESAQIFATVAHSTDAAIIAEGDAALAPLGFHRDSVGTTYPRNLVPGIFASYKAGASAAALIVEGTRTGCIVFSTTNYDEDAAGLAKSAAAAVKARFGSSFGKDVTFFSEASCTHAL